MRSKNLTCLRYGEPYHNLFGLDMVLDNDGNMILTEGLVLQDEKIWKKKLKGYQNDYRLRVGNFRVQFSLDNDIITIGYTFARRNRSN